METEVFGEKGEFFFQPCFAAINSLSHLIHWHPLRFSTIFLRIFDNCQSDLGLTGQISDRTWKKSYDQPRQHIKKQRHLPTKVYLVKAMVLPVVMYGCESWTIKKAKCQRIDAFELWCWRRLLRVSWTARRSNKSILKEISPEYSLEELMLKEKLQ